jgi:hypothetical protein|tara:strand:- start:182 stop:886 length:705 start_codon:yes stop_codon:yes gene_type:complete
MTNLYNDNSDIQKNQDMYDSYNGFIFSNDRVVFNKLYSKIYFYEMTKHLPGDIVECGVFKGSGLLAWLKILAMNEPNSIKKVLGFDFFNPSFVDNMKSGVDKDTMKQVFTRDKNLEISDVSYDGIYNKIINAGFDSSKFELVKGDIIETSQTVVEEKPGLRISILYLDMDLDKPTYAALKTFWNNIVSGGVIIFDEYAYHSWSESNGADDFIKEMGLTLHTTGIKAPTAYIIKA